ncbi:hypothetical protein IRJ41_007946 [Triplophysa rosa]|uniref:Uncharacterized protein n=1 Tax=Triplophysa rosa TaxID=992332 RepID=A0A9W7WA07_TRIRA|nr:hypothetical protein IRJ41_007946 [Triplophysa rosa]
MFFAFEESLMSVAQKVRGGCSAITKASQLRACELILDITFCPFRCLAPWALHKSGPDGAKVVSDHQHMSAFSHSSCKFCSRDFIRQDYYDVHCIEKHVRSVYPLLSIDSSVGVAVTPVLWYLPSELSDFETVNMFDVK